jgi:hypothetical protein
VIVGRLPAEGSWDLEVARELARSGQISMVLVSTDHAPFEGVTIFAIDRSLDRNERARWFSAAAHEL